MTAVADLKRVHRATWAAGDYAAVAEIIDEVAAARPARPHRASTPGQEVLDVATGTGNLARPCRAPRALSVTAPRPRLPSCSRPPGARARRAASAPTGSRATPNPPFRGRQLRPCPRRLRRAVRAPPRARGGRARARLPAGWPDRRSSTGRPKTRSASCSGSWRPTCRPARLRLAAAALGEARSMSGSSFTAAGSSSSSRAATTRAGSTPPSTTRVHRDELRPDPEGPRAAGRRRRAGTSAGTSSLAHGRGATRPASAASR